ncbi:MAG: type II secretion system protein GspM [Geminicoccaceae bacterium]
MLAPGSFMARIAAVAIFAILLFAVNQFAVQPLLETYRDNQVSIANAQERLRRYQALAEEKPGLTDRLALLESDVEASTAYLEGGSDALAAAMLQNLVANAIDGAGGQVKSLRSLPAVDVEDRSDVHRTGVQLRFAADIDSFAEALYDLESMDPVLSIDRLEVTAAVARRAKNDVDAPQMLEVRLDIYGYARLQK